MWTAEEGTVHESDEWRDWRENRDKDFHSPILAVTIVTQQINS